MGAWTEVVLEKNEVKDAVIRIKDEKALVIGKIARINTEKVEELGEKANLNKKNIGTRRETEVENKTPWVIEKEANINKIKEEIARRYGKIVEVKSFEIVINEKTVALVKKKKQKHWVRWFKRT